MPSHHIDNGSGNEERRDAPRPSVDELGVGVLDQRKTANPRTNDATDAGGQVFAQGLSGGQTGILYGLHSCSNTVVDERVHGTRIFGADVGLQVEPLDLAGNLAGEVRCIELGDEVNAGLPGQEIGPGISHRVSHGTDTTQAGHDDATTAHALNLVLIAEGAPGAPLRP